MSKRTELVRRLKANHSGNAWAKHKVRSARENRQGKRFRAIEASARDC